MARYFILVLAVLVTAGASLAAGELYYPDSNAGSGGLESFPWANAQIRYHALVPATALGGKACRITGLSFATGAVSTFTAPQCEITLAHLSPTGTLSTIFANNLQKDATVLFSGPITWPCAVNQWCPLGLTGNFNYNGVDQIVIEVRFYGGAGGVSCRSAKGVQNRFTNGPGAYSAPNADPLGTLSAPKMRLTYSETMLNASGSPMPGGAVTLDLLSTGDAGLAYQLASSFGSGPILIDTRRLELSPDALLFLTVLSAPPGIFQNYAGVLGAQGQAKAAIKIPNLPSLKGIRIYTAFVTLKATAPSGVASISNTFVFTIQ